MKKIRSAKDSIYTLNSQSRVCASFDTECEYGLVGNNGVCGGTTLLCAVAAASAAAIAVAVAALGAVLCAVCMLEQPMCVPLMCV